MHSCLLGPLARPQFPGFRHQWTLIYAMFSIFWILDFAAAGWFEAWQGGFGVIADVNYASISDSGLLPGPAGASFPVNKPQKWLALMAANPVADGKRIRSEVTVGR